MINESNERNTAIAMSAVNDILRAYHLNYDADVGVLGGEIFFLIQPAELLGEIIESAYPFEKKRRESLNLDIEDDMPNHWEASTAGGSIALSDTVKCQSESEVRRLVAESISISMQNYNVHQKMLDIRFNDCNFEKFYTKDEIMRELQRYADWYSVKARQIRSDFLI